MPKPKPKSSQTNLFDVYTLKYNYDCDSEYFKFRPQSRVSATIQLNGESIVWVSFIYQNKDNAKDYLCRLIDVLNSGKSCDRFLGFIPESKRICIGKLKEAFCV